MKTTMSRGPTVRWSGSLEWLQPIRLALAVCAGLLLSCAVAGWPSAAQTKQDALAANVDPGVSPAEDFFQFANGEWLRRHPIPDDQARWGVTNVISDEIYSQIRRISEDAAAKKASRGSAEQLVGDFWVTAMDVATMHRRARLIDGPLGQQRVFFSASVEQDERDSRRWVYTVSQGGISMRRQAYSADDAQSVRIRNACRDYLLKTFLRIHGDPARATSSVDAVFKLETTLAAAVQPGNDSHPMQLDELRRFTALDWKRYLNQVGVGSIEFVNMRHPQFFLALDAALRTTPLDHWKDYLRYWLVRVNAPFRMTRPTATFSRLKAPSPGSRSHVPVGGASPGSRKTGLDYRW
jgi:putative endopeptidase